MTYRTLLKRLHEVYEYSQLSKLARAEYLKDRKGLPDIDPGVDRVLEEAVAWLYRAQDNSRTRDGGVARHFSLLTGWGSSYPETTGYIVPTLISYAKLRRSATAVERTQRMLNWLTSIQLSDGAFQGGCVDELPVVPVTFNTGQILLGLASGSIEFGDEYRYPLRRAADWLVRTQDSDGCWRRYPTPFAEPGEKTYETHVAWALLEADRIDSSRGYADAALANIRWALAKQTTNGWFSDCCLSNPSQPLTHTVGYALRGLVEAYRFTGDQKILEACRRTADGVLSAIQTSGFLPGRLNADWSAAVSWMCLTGSAQIASCWFLLYEATGNEEYRDAARAANRCVRCTVSVDGPDTMRGAVKGAFPIDGNYGRFEYLNWASKFLVDANLMEQRLTGSLTADHMR